MKNRFGVTLALLAILSFGGMALATPPAKGKDQNANTSMTTSSSATNRASRKSRKSSHRRRRRVRKHRKQMAAAVKTNRQPGSRR